MSAAELLTLAAKDGVVLVLEGDRLIWEADHQPSDWLLSTIRACKLELIKELKPVTGQAYWNGTEPQQVIQTAATASTGWIAASDQYIGHLMACKGCHAPTGRYCSVGAELRQRYEVSA